MPYPTEHSARLRDPKEFKPDTYKRVDGGKLFGRVKVPKTIAILSAKLKGKDKPSDPYIAQSLRFPVKNWTASEAKAWLKKNKVDFILFEPAKKSKDKQSADQNTASRQACIFGQGCEVSFAEAGDEQEAGRFRIVAYSGKVIPEHWLWGNVAFDLAGLKFDRRKTAVLEEHFSANRIGFTTKQQIRGKVIVEGKFLNNPRAQQTRQDIEDGFPMQASLYVPPGLIEHVREGESAEVNGQKLKGPGTVFRKATIKEVSMCALGADSHTQSRTFAEGEREIQFNVLEKERIMDEQTSIAELTAETFAAEDPDVIEQAAAEAKAKNEKDGKPATWDAALKQRMTETKCSEADAVRFCVAEYPGLHAKMLQKQGEMATDDVKPEPDQTVKFWSAVERRMKQANCSKAEAIRFTVREQPEMHEEFLEKLKTLPKPKFTEFWNKVKEYRDKTGCGDGDAIRACFSQYPELVDFFAAVKHHMRETQDSQADSIRFCVREFPELYLQFLEDQTEKAKVSDITSEPDQLAAENRDAQPATWEAAIKQQTTETKCSQADAVRFCVRKYPELHRKMLEEQKG